MFYAVNMYFLACSTTRVLCFTAENVDGRPVLFGIGGMASPASYVMTCFGLWIIHGLLQYYNYSRRFILSEVKES
eukprot:scaffold2987_cov170-Amphora_coffeaeformis.AAC.29